MGTILTRGSLRRTLRPLPAPRIQFRQLIPRRYQATNGAAAPEQTLLQRIWSSPVGVKTVHFWAPVMKWALVLTGLSDLARPAEKLSFTQNFSLMCTGAIWTRWCFVIRPQNMLLAAVNFFLGIVGITQVGRIMTYHKSLKDQSLSEALKVDAKDIESTAEGIMKDPGGARGKAAKA